MIKKKMEAPEGQVGRCPQGRKEKENSGHEIQMMPP